MKHITDLINCEGAILALYQETGTYYLASYLKDKTGTIYYRTTLNDLQDYLDSKIKLSELYERSEDTFVFSKHRNEKDYFLKEEMANYISYADVYFKAVPNGMRIHFNINE